YHGVWEIRNPPISIEEFVADLKERLEENRPYAAANFPCPDILPGREPVSDLQEPIPFAAVILRTNLSNSEGLAFNSSAGRRPANVRRRSSGWNNYSREANLNPPIIGSAGPCIFPFHRRCLQRPRHYRLRWSWFKPMLPIKSWGMDC
ncbi:MAG: hypothetical protein KDA84_19250, partial [Planctomycetaceae bacterium]|nr:hypothetical protein [Planctomycetaceae bacterium]